MEPPLAELFDEMRRTGKNRGFTLLEATFAMVILAAAASGIFLSFSTAATVQYEAHHRVLASRLACDKIEEIAAMGYDDIKNDIVPQSFPLPPQTAEERGYTGVYNGLSCTVKECREIELPAPPGGTTVNLIEITVAAYYKDMEITRVTTLIGDKTKH